MVPQLSRYCVFYGRYLDLCLRCRGVVRGRDKSVVCVGCLITFASNSLYSGRVCACVVPAVAVCQCRGRWFGEGVSLLLCYVVLGIDVGGHVGMDESQAGRAVSEIKKWAAICVCSGTSAAIIVFFYIIVGRCIGRYSNFWDEFWRGYVVVIIIFVSCSAYIRSIFRQGQRRSSETVLVNVVMGKILRPVPRIRPWSGC